MKKTLLVITLILLGLLVSGCIVKVGKKPPTDAGIFKSYDKGLTWQSKYLFWGGGGVGSIAYVNVSKMVFDPQDNLAVYLATRENGLIYTYTGGENWLQSPISAGQIESIAIDPKNKCVIYVAYGNRILKSVDCNRSFEEIYVDNRPNIVVTSLVIDSYNNLKIYAGVSTGEIVKSFDGGISWQRINNFNNKVAKILINPNDTRIVYVATQNRGIFKTTDEGNSWQEINENLKFYAGAFDFKDLIFDYASNGLILASKYGLIKSADEGETWQALNLITPPGSVDINAVAVNPIDSNGIYYTTSSVFYKTEDGGKNWITRKLPSLSIATALLVDYRNPNILYMGMTQVKK